MAFIKSKPKYFFIITIIFLGILPSVLTAKVFISTTIISGEIISISPENKIMMSDGNLYSPGKKDIILTVKPDEYVSLKYFIDSNSERKYIEYAPGKNSLKSSPVPKNTTKPKRKL